MISPYKHNNSVTSTKHDNLHLFVICANLAFSDENASSRSKRSNEGGGSSLKAGGNTCEWKRKKDYVMILFYCLCTH